MKYDGAIGDRVVVVIVVGCASVADDDVVQQRTSRSITELNTTPVSRDRDS